jgi:hypothetical protein
MTFILMVACKDHFYMFADAKCVCNKNAFFGHALVTQAMHGRP